MIEHDKIKLIESYVSSYNSFDVAGLLALLDENVVFENESNGEINVRSEGKRDFEKLAYESAKIFSSRQQTITDVVICDSTATVNINYKGTLAIDLPNGLKTGQVLELKGRTYFEFTGGKICHIKDVS
ncbi:nuclear transport factor 2 family protein [Vibrio cholerae]|uniref:nuclear transport factor 2 family protein n=1 Tax=Vibrio cholerae TaxID=666 RepID=UPI00208AE795|nr:nuclear transport factor 2 family protein [Vibrio cholerae]EJI2332413.1 nuclear transport factor 2 family protein [Vibrio cholerae]EKF9566633.1 nuclear transport factor 2 family protein [Vibrio cholerae]ELK6278498.1 nuclear transport factor 2 family protein [Vibrio cholerae]ELP4887175.1 nuclear transport factor 2 family protein [Vibrio cholerae]ELT8460435.1 nuclear transport factor 2 family protein [Vibrio cholerae]